MSDAESRANDLRDAADRSAGLTRNLYFTFLLLAAYVTVIIGSTTDEQLLRVSPVTLPLLNVGVPIVAFYTLIPWLVVLFHFNLLLQVYLLSRKLHRFDAALSEIEDETARRDQQTQLFPFPFSHMLIGREHGALMRVLFAVMVWVTLLLIPLGLLVWAQIRFLPYHDPVVTWGQRAAVLIDLALAWTFWPIIVAPDGKAATWWRGIIAIRARGWETLVPTSMAAAILCFFTALVPGEALDRWLALEVSTGREGEVEVQSGLLGLTTTLFDAPGAPFHRNLRLADTNLAAETLAPKTVAELRGFAAENRAAALQDVVPLNLSNRDLRFADMRNVLLPKAVLRGANLDGADLRGAILPSADLRPFDPEGGRCVRRETQLQVLKPQHQSTAGLTPKETDIPVCVTSLQGARLARARMEGARLQRTRLEDAELSDIDLENSDLRRARLDRAQLFRARLEGADLRLAGLRGAILRRADLQRANLTSAKLMLADLGEARLDGATLRRADLTGADLDRAWLIAADLRSARLEAAVLKAARLEGARLQAAKMTGANLEAGRLQGADLSRAVLKGAILVGVKIGATRTLSADLDYTDLRRVKVVPLTEAEFQKLQEHLTKTIKHETARQRMTARVSGAVDVGGSLRGTRETGVSLCSDDPPLDPCMPASAGAQFAALVVNNVLAPLACGKPDIARGLVSELNISRGEPLPSIHRKVALAKALLDQDCAAGAAVAADLAERLPEMCTMAQFYNVTCDLPVADPPTAKKDR